MTEDETHKGCVEFVVSEEDFTKGKVLKPKTDRFREVQLVKKVQKRDKDDPDAEPEDTDDYVRIQLSTIGQEFGKQVDIFVHTDYHPAIVQFEGYGFYPYHMAVTKYYPKGSLQHILKKKPSEWNGTMKSICVYGLVSAVTHIHNIHDENNKDFSIRYLCPENIIFDSDNHPRLIHYVFGNEELGKTPNAYIPPELHKNPKGARYDEDVWAIGMILYEILTGHVPYQGKSEDEIKAAILKGELPELPPKSDDTNHIVGIIQNCLDPVPTNRPLPYMIYHHLTNTSDDLFPGTDKVVFGNYRDKVSELTIQSQESLSYIETEEEAVEPEEDLFKKAEEGDPNALVRTGRMYQKGFGGVDVDEEKGFENYMKAADADYPIGMYNAALCLMSGRGCDKDLEQAFELMEKASKLDLENAVYQHAVMLRDGIGTKKNMKKAIDAFKKGSQKNNRKCQYALATLYYDGCPDLKKDVNEALKLYKKAASQGYAAASADIAYHYYEQGKEEEDDSKIQKAINLFKKAARQKSASALLNLGKIYKEGKVVPKDAKQSAEYYKQAANLKDIQGMIEYGVCLKNGIGVKKDVKEASVWYRKAADEGDKRGQHNYAKTLYDGEGGVKKDVMNASRYFKKAADQGVPQSMFYYAKILINGEGGVVKDLATGKKYLKKYTDCTKKEKWLPGTNDLNKKVNKKADEDKDDDEDDD